MRGQEEEQREIRGTGYGFRQVFCSPQPRGFVTSNKHELKTARFFTVYLTMTKS